MQREWSLITKQVKLDPNSKLEVEEYWKQRRGQARHKNEKQLTQKRTAESHQKTRRKVEVAQIENS